MKRRSWVLVCASVLLVAVAVVLAWPPADPLAGAHTVALHDAAGAETSPVNVDAELMVVLNNRHLTLVTDERVADVVLAVTHVRFGSGNLQLELNGGKLSGRATAVCRVVNVKTKRAYVMDLLITLRSGEVRATLAGRRFWQFWKPRTTL